MSFLQKKTVIIVAAFLLVIGVGMAFAADGISLDWRDNTVYVTNSNKVPYDVAVQVTYSANGYRSTTRRSVNVKAGKTGSFSIGTSAIIERAEVIDARPGL
ncbi:MAG: hypothetical protein LBK25_04245 [Treponema sp.]|jgi:hypothetical protein|nr:hypothetical protein [Treponema sp.]